MLQKPILILTQPFYPVPSTNDGAVSLVIEDTIEGIGPRNLKVLSIWEDRMDSMNYDRRKILFVHHKSMLLRIAKRVFTRSLRSMLPFPLPYTKYLDMLLGAAGYSLLYQPQLIVVHSTRCEWIIDIKRIFSRLNKKVVWYHHTSEDQNVDEAHLSHFQTIDAHIFVSEYSRRQFVERVAPFDSSVLKKSYVVRNGINTQSFQPDPQLREHVRDQYHIAKDTLVVLFIGKIIPRKGLERLLDAILLLPKNLATSVTLIAVGAADYYNNKKTDYSIKVEQKAQSVGLTVHFTGYVPHKEILKYYCAADLLVFPSIEEEGLPLTILEAQSTGLPVIVSNTGGVEEVVVPGETGFIYPRDADCQEISKYLEQLCTQTSLREHFSQRAKEHILNNFSRERMSSDFLKVISEVSGVQR